MKGPRLSQLVRYGPVLRLARQASGRRLLDVGSGGGGLGPLLGPEWEVTATDVDFSDYGVGTVPPGEGISRVTADARELPFSEGAFDVVTAIDLIEHLEPGARPAALAELVRVARERVIVAFPAGAAAEDSDRSLGRFYVKRGVGHQPWLAEHLEHGLPAPDLLEAALSRADGPRLVRNENLYSHSLLMRIEAYRPGAVLSLGLGSALRGGAGRRGPRALLLAAIRGFDLAPSYRIIGVA